MIKSYVKRLVEKLKNPEDGLGRRPTPLELRIGIGPDDLADLSLYDNDPIWFDDLDEDVTDEDMKNLREDLGDDAHLLDD